MPPGTNINKNECLRFSKYGTKLIKAVSPRPDHSTTVTSSEILVYPLHPPRYSKPLFSSGDYNDVKESQPVQVTDHATDSLDSSRIATNVSSHYRPALRTAHQNRNPSEYGLPTSDISTSTQSSNLYTSSVYFSERQTAGHAAAYIPKPPRYSNYISSTNRNSSFESRIWDVNNKPDIRTLVAFGFFYTGNADLVRCFQCGIGLKDWVKDDDVLAEHIKYSSECDFLCQKIGRTEVERLKDSLSSPENATSGNQNASNSYKIRSPRYQTMDARMASFTSFPQRILIQHRTLAVAGLYYTGNGDLCRCFACDGGLKDWSTGDDPIQEHATYFPNCPYINQLKGQEYVNQMQTRRTNNSFFGTHSNESMSQEQGATSQGSEQSRINQGAMSQVSQSFGTLSMDEMSIENNSYSALATQVFHQLGYSELDVATARAELQRKGNRNPKSEDIVNTILDIQERTSRQDDSVKRKDNKTELQEMLEENKRLLEFVHCKLCVTGEPDILFLPCAHNKICHKCAENLTHCPVCQKQIKEKIKTYRA